MINLNSRQRILAAFYLEEPDTVPTSTYMSPYWLSNKWVDEKTYWHFAKESDAIFRVGVGIKPSKDPSKVKVTERSWNESGRRITLRRIDTPNGTLRSISEAIGYSSRTVEGLLKTEKDIEIWFSIPYAPAEIDPEPFFFWDKKLGDDGIAVCSTGDSISEVWHLFSIKDFLKYCIMKPHIIEEMLKIILERRLIFLSAVMEKGITMFWFSGPEYVTPTFISRKYFPKFVTKYDRELVKLIHQYDGVAYMHCHGRIADIIQEFPKIGIDALDTLDPSPQGDADLAEAKRLIGDKICLVGNIDSNNVMVQGTPEMVTESAKQCIEKAAYGGGYILQPTSGSIFNTPLENIETLVKAGRKYGKY